VVQLLPIKNQHSTIVTRQFLPHAGRKNFNHNRSASDMDELGFEEILTTDFTTSTNNIQKLILQEQTKRK